MDEMIDSRNLDALRTLDEREPNDGYSAPVDEPPRCPYCDAVGVFCKEHVQYECPDDNCDYAGAL